MQNFEKILELLIDNEVEFVLVGGFAATVHGVTLLTHDIDVCVPFNVENAGKIISAFKEHHPKYSSNKLPLSSDVEYVAALKNLYLTTDLGNIDMLGLVGGLGSYQDVVQHAIEIEIFGRVCKVLDIDALIKAKKAMGGPKDHEAVAQLNLIKKSLGLNRK